MKCKKCGSEWNISKGMNTAIDKCPFCGASLVSADDDLEGIMRWIVQTRGISVFLNDGTINGILSDLIQGDNRYKRQIKIALSAGAGRAFYSMVSKGTMSKLERTSRMTSLLIDEGFSESFANDIASIFEYSITASDSPAEDIDNNGADSNDDSFNEDSFKHLMNRINSFLKVNDGPDMPEDSDQTAETPNREDARDPEQEARRQRIKEIDDRINELENKLADLNREEEALNQEIEKKKQTIASIEETIKGLEGGKDKSSLELARRILNKNKKELQELLLKRKKLVGEDKRDETDKSNDADIISNEKRTMKIVSEDGTTEEVEVIFNFQFKDNKNEYVIYTKNETDENGDVTVYVSNVDRSTGEPKLMSVDDDDWPRVQDVLHELSKPN